MLLYFTAGSLLTKRLVIQETILQCIIYTAVVHLSSKSDLLVPAALLLLHTDHQQMKLKSNTASTEGTHIQ